MCKPDVTELRPSAARSIVIVGGVHGAGKTTLCRELSRAFELPYISPQQVAREMAPIQLTWPRLLARVRERVNEQLGSGESFCFEHVMSGHYVEKLIQQAKDAAFAVDLIYINVDQAGRVSDRIDGRVKSGGHDTDRSLLAKRLRESRSNFWHRYRTAADRWHLLENSTEQYQQIASGRSASEPTRTVNASLLDAFTTQVAETAKD